MWQLVREVLSTPVGSFAFILSFMILAGWLIHYITRFITKWTCNMEGSKSTVDKVESNIDSIRSDISYIKGMINKLTKVPSRQMQTLLLNPIAQSD